MQNNKHSIKVILSTSITKHQLSGLHTLTFFVVVVIVSTGMTASATKAAFQLCPDHMVHNIIPGLAAGWLGQWERSFLPKETTAAESPGRASNLEPYDCQADALAVCYCLPLTYIKYI